ncbi:MAG: ATP-binding cassette domain-containing protein [Acidimicrobiales bacterium]
MLSIKELAAGYRDVVVREVTFTAVPGEILAIVGVNGAGKSTILKSIIGEATVHSGRIFLGDKDVTGTTGHILARQRLGYLPQVKDVFSGLSVAENLKMGGFLMPRGRVGKRIAEMFERFPQLADKKGAMAHTLSGGERKQLAVARALMPGPAVLLMDEPTANLSPKVAEELLFGHIKQLAADGMAVVVVEQRVELVLEAADRACLIGGGRMQHLSSAREVWERVQAGGLVHETT